ncbi:MAG TPA: permease-like cell division protein FtsX [bacterium]|nr:permease-like cell division protein FtsX [bacterium]
MRPASWSFFLHECWLGFRRHGAATLTTLLQCIASLTLLGVCLAFIINANQLTRGFLSSLEMVVWLEPEVTTGEADLLQVQLAKLPGVQTIVYVPKEEAYRRAQEMLPFPVNESLAEGNPYPASFEIKVTHAAAMGPLQDYIARQVPGVEGVTGPQDFKTILPFMFFVQAACFFFTLILAGTTLFTIKNTIQLAILSRRPEIKVMQLVGATPTFVRIPFLMEGLFYGVIGAAVAWLVVVGLYAMAQAWLVAQDPMAIMAKLPMVAFNEFIVLGVVGTLVGFLGALVSVDRHLSEKYQHSSAPAMGAA